MFIIIILIFAAMYIVYRLLANADPKSPLIAGTKKIYAYRRLQRKKKRNRKKNKPKDSTDSNSEAGIS